MHLSKGGLRLWWMEAGRLVNIQATAESPSNLLYPADQPVVAELAASPSGGVRPGGNFTLTCRAEAWPPAQISWRAPPGALNIGLSSNNSTLSVAGALGSHGGEYECAATNAHGRHSRRIIVRVAGKWPLGGKGEGFAGARGLRLGTPDLIPASLSVLTEETEGVQGRSRGHPDECVVVVGGCFDGEMEVGGGGRGCCMNFKERDPLGL